MGNRNSSIKLKRKKTLYSFARCSTILDSASIYSKPDNNIVVLEENLRLYCNGLMVDPDQKREMEFLFFDFKRDKRFELVEFAFFIFESEKKEGNDLLQFFSEKWSHFMSVINLSYEHIVLMNQCDRVKNITFIRKTLSEILTMIILDLRNSMLNYTF